MNARKNINESANFFGYCLILYKEKMLTDRATIKIIIEVLKFIYFLENLKLNTIFCFSAKKNPVQYFLNNQQISNANNLSNMKT